MSQAYKVDYVESLDECACGKCGKAIHVRDFYFRKDVDVGDVWATVYKLCSECGVVALNGAMDKPMEIPLVGDTIEWTAESVEHVGLVTSSQCEHIDNRIKIIIEASS